MEWGGGHGLRGREPSRGRVGPVGCTLLSSAPPLPPLPSPPPSPQWMWLRGVCHPHEGVRFRSAAQLARLTKDIANQEAMVRPLVQHYVTAAQVCSAHSLPSPCRSPPPRPPPPTLAVFPPTPPSLAVTASARASCLNPTTPGVAAASCCMPCLGLGCRCVGCLPFGGRRGGGCGGGVWGVKGGWGGGWHNFLGVCACAWDMRCRGEGGLRGSDPPVRVRVWARAPSPKTVFLFCSSPGARVWTECAEARARAGAHLC